MKDLNQWLQDWLERSEIPTRKALAEELSISRSAISHWTGRHNAIPEDRLKEIDTIYPVDLPGYFKLMGLPYDETKWE